ncbi:DegT/DnrJ/EryC1/StrS family aminotransferase [bacterium]|nr:DegT/DnrJ/EryC1/StrS family aminotransferase [bacterium]
MKKIQMVDLGSQHDRLKNPIDNAILNTISSCAFINGPQVKSFAKELAGYLNVNHVIPCANGTDALQLALMALDLQPGDEVITTSFTFIATVEVIALLKLKPVLVDVDPHTFNIDPVLIEKAITPKTKAIIPVHLFGQGADMERIMDIANKNNLFVIEDTAQATGANFLWDDKDPQKLGTIGHIGTTSFFPSKNLGCYGDGGACFTNDEDLAKKLRILANHGSEVKYYHDSIGVNSRLDSIQAAILSVKLPHLDEFNSNRQKVAEYYNQAFEKNEQIITPFVLPKTEHIYHQYTLKLFDVDREGLKNHLQSKGIPSMIYYPVPLHKQKAFAQYVDKENSLPIAEALCQVVLSLPVHTEMDEEQLKLITESVLEFIEKK